MFLSVVAPPYGNPAGGYISPTYTGSPNAPAVPIIGSNSYPRPSAPPQLGTAAGPVIGSNPHPRPSAPSQLGNAVRFAANAGRLMGGIGGITGNCSGSDLGTMDSGYAELM